MYECQILVSPWASIFVEAVHLSLLCDECILSASVFDSSLYSNSNREQTYTPTDVT